MSSSVFQFKQFEVEQKNAPMKIGTDGILLGAWASVEKAESALDIGTGNGFIALMLAQRGMKLKIDAIEIDENSFRQASDNFNNSMWQNRLHAIHAPIQEYASATDKKYDLIVSNPPFFTGGTFSYNENRNNVRHTIKLPMGDLLLAVRRLMHAQSRFCIILPHIEGLQFMERAKFMSLHCTACTKVLTVPGKPIERLLMQFELAEEKHVICQESELIVYQDANSQQYTEAYKKLTQDFYLNM